MVLKYDYMNAIATEGPACFSASALVTEPPLDAIKEEWKPHVAPLPNPSSRGTYYENVERWAKADAIARQRFNRWYDSVHMRNADRGPGQTCELFAGDYR